MSEQVVKILRAAKNLLETKGWTQGSFARNEQGNTCFMNDSEASCFCSRGAIYKVSSEFLERNSPIVFDAERALRRAMESNSPASSGTCGIVIYNDAPERTKEEVLLKFAEAIAEEEKE